MKALAASLAVALVLLVAVAVAGATAAAADVSGTWNVEGDVVGNAVKFTCTLKQTGEALAGTAKIEGKDSTMKGTVKDRVVSFEFDVDYQGSTYHNVYTGKVNDNGSAIDGKIEVAGVEGVFSAKKQ